MIAHLLLQADNAGPLLLKETLIFLSRSIVKLIADIYFFAEGRGSVCQASSGKVGNQRLVAISTSANSTRIVFGKRTVLQLVAESEDWTLW
jgi:hypothetical protein